jgi:hypothetical protein
MRYMLLIYTSPEKDTQPGDEGRDELMAAYAAFSEEARRVGAIIAAHELQPVQTATTVRVRDGKVTLTDGPFAETRETLGGFYLIDCRDLDQALALAAKVPSAKGGSIEVRPTAQ